MGFFRIKPIARLILKREISGSHTISDQSLLLSTNVLNDYVEMASGHGIHMSQKVYTYIIEIFIEADVKVG